MKMSGSQLALLGMAMLAGSIALNFILGRTSLHYYMLLNKVSLDPFGLRKVSDDPINKAAAHRVVMIGDSRAQAWPPPPGIESAEFINQGISGQTTAQVLGRFQKHVADLEPDIVLIQVGINDLKTIPLFPDRRADIIEQCASNIQELASRSLDTGAKVIVTTIIPAGRVPLVRIPFWPSEVDQAVDSCNTSIETLSSNRVIVFDTSAIVSGGNGSVQPKYQRDFLHLNRAGYQALNRELSSALNALLQEHQKNRLNSVQIQD
jgi:lysophospholipase L1-like esterase